jgi:hypothetical protein
VPQPLPIAPGRAHLPGRSPRVSGANPAHGFTAERSRKPAAPLARHHRDHRRHEAGGDAVLRGGLDVAGVNWHQTMVSLWF